MDVPQRMPDFHLHQAELGRVALKGRLAKVGLQCGEQGGFVPIQCTGQPLQLSAPERRGPRRACPEEGALTLADGGKVHNELGQTHIMGY
jgi:hypothetical protein